MKITNFFKYSWVVFGFCILCIAVLCFSGCFQAAGETKSQVHQRRMRVINTQKRQIMDDIDATLLLDKPSKLNDKVIR